MDERDFDPAVWRAFWDALEPCQESAWVYVDEEIDIVDGLGSRVLEALLAAGWLPPDLNRSRKS